MKKKDNTEIDNALNNFPDNLTVLIKESLNSKNSIKKLAARSTLVRMGKTIIVPLDFSDESLTGLNLALMLAAKTGANIQLVHVIGKNIGTNKELLEKENQLAKTKFEDILQKCKAKGNINCALNYTIKEGQIFKEIADLADKYEDALTVLSTHGASGFEELFIGYW